MHQHFRGNHHGDIRIAYWPFSVLWLRQPKQLRAAPYRVDSSQRLPARAHWYRYTMNTPVTSTVDTVEPTGFARIFQWRRTKVVLSVCAVIILLFSFGWKVSYAFLFGRILFTGFSMLFVFGLFERWPRRLPRWMARWVLQVAGVAAVVPFALWIGYAVTNVGMDPPWWRDQQRLTAYGTFTFLGLLIGPWIAVTALLKQIRDDARKQALMFELERSQLERKALDARMRLLQAQVEPHFLFNTLANVRQLVEVGSPQAPQVLDSLIAYLRAAVPRLHEKATTLGEELQLVRAYLELMHMRMPDRLQFALDVDEGATPLRCPPMTLLTLVENAVRHGIDPGEEGGRIDVSVKIRDGRCIARVTDTGVGLAHGGQGNMGLGTGLSSLRERLELAFHGDAKLRIAEAGAHGVSAEVEFPAEPG